MGIIAEFKGQNGKIIVHDEYLVLSRKTFSGYISQGGASGDRKYFYKNIDSIEYKKPTIIANGYYKIILPGTIETNAKVGILGSSKDSMKDQNTIVLRAFSKKIGNETDRIHDILMQKITEAKNNNNSSNDSDKFDRLKKLGELKESGILSDEEFQIEKEKLLS